MEKLRFKRTKYACYFTYLAMSPAFSLPAILFATFREQYGISYTLLGTLVLINFCTQLTIDLIFSFFSKHFNIQKTIRIMPLLTALGLCTYALIPTLLPQYAYAGLVIGTVIFSVAAGLGEVLISPTVAALPSDTPEKDMSALHSLYGYGVVSVVLISTVFLQLVGTQYWMYLTFFWAILPIIASALLTLSPLPDMNMGQEKAKKAKSRRRTVGLMLCVLCIFLGSSAENTMSNWISVFAENSLNMPKIWGDVFGMCLFAALLAITRTAYAKYGKNIFRTLCVSMAGAALCYLAVAFSQSGSLSLAACVALGIFTSMLWPGALILMEERVPSVGVAAYALMAAGGDLGASIVPQGMGIIVDNIALTEWAAELAGKLSVSPEDIGFKTGMIIVAVFPALGLLLLAYMKKYFGIKSEKKASKE